MSAGSSETQRGRLNALRQELRRRGVDAFIVPSGDPHFSEYSAACFERREFISGFTGSAGIAVITTKDALLWTDGRYYLQASQQLDKNWTLMRAGLEETPTVRAFLAKNLSAGAKIGVDPLMHSIDDATKLETTLGGAGMSLVSLSHPNPIDVVWGSERPQLPCTKVRCHDLRYAGVSTEDKLASLRARMSEKSCEALLVTSLDEVCWLLNIRGDDVPHCPVVLAYAVVHASGGVSMHVDESKVEGEVADVLSRAEVSVKPYESIEETIGSVCGKGGRIWLDPNTTSMALRAAAGESAHLEQSPIVLAKAQKNAAELEGMREAHLRDAVALCSFLAWLEAHVNNPGGSISEFDAANKLREFRASQAGFLDTSFDTIAGSGPNGAIIHYRAEQDTCRHITNSELLLLDSGGQYRDGTTDVTRTMHLGGTASQHERECFTRVLQGHMAIDSIVFPAGTTGFMLDTLARGPLWSMGLDYRHGTGHGVGACLNVHEGPHSISPRVGSNRVALREGMIVSNEPGYYEDGAFGIRLENLVAVVEKETPHAFSGSKFLGFSRLTHVPIDKSMIIPEFLTPSEVTWLDEYHEQVWQKLSPRMEDGSSAKEWLWEKTRPLQTAVGATP